MYVTWIIVALALIAIGSLAAVLQRYARRITGLQGEKSSLEVDLAATKANLENAKEQLAREQALSKEMDERLRSGFKNIAAEIISDQSAKFKLANQESLEKVVDPFKQKINEFRERIESIYTTERTEKGELKNELKRLQELNQAITAETTNLTRALKGDNKVQGDWGEVMLKAILTNSGLVEGVHFTLQANLKDEMGNNLRPDAILHFPDGKDIVIDSKVSLTAYLRYCQEENAALKKPHLDEHLRSVRTHLTLLGSKKYQDLAGSPFVIMFMAQEPAYLEALHKEPEIWADAYSKGVIISSPTNLFALLKIVDDFWQRDKQGKNAIEIAKAGGDLYDKFVSFAESLIEVGKGIDRASASYDKAINQLKDGKGSLVSRTEKLKKLGIKASKNLPLQLEDADTEE